MRKYFSLFSGVEGFGLGLGEGWEPTGFSEIDKYANQVLKYRFPKVKNYGDITKIKWKQVPDFDLLTGGSPCQDFSIAGKRRGLAGSRSSLAWEYIRCLRDKQPRYFIWENVKGVMSSRGGWDFANLLIAFSESGYALWWQVLNAKDFSVPQNRERIFVVGFREGSPKEVFFEPKGVSGNFKGKPDDSEISRTISARFRKGVGNTESRIIDVLVNASQGQRIRNIEGLASTLQGLAGGQGAKTGLYAIPVITPDRLKKRQNGRRFKNNNDPSFTINTQDRHGIFNGESIRRLTPTECERLMSWPDNWTKFGIDEKGNKVEVSDSQRYKMCGNGVVSKVVEKLSQELL